MKQLSNAAQSIRDAYFREVNCGGTAGKNKLNWEALVPAQPRSHLTTINIAILLLTLTALALTLWAYDDMHSNPPRCPKQSAMIYEAFVLVTDTVAYQL